MSTPPPPTSRVRAKQNDGITHHKTGPLKATLPMSSVLRSPLLFGATASTSTAGSSGGGGGGGGGCVSTGGSCISTTTTPTTTTQIPTSVVGVNSTTNTTITTTPSTTMTTMTTTTTIPPSSNLTPNGKRNSGVFSALSPPLARHISPPDYNSVVTLCGGHRSPGAQNYTGLPQKIVCDPLMRRTASLDALYMRASWSRSTVVAAAAATATNATSTTSNNSLPLRQQSAAISPSKIIQISSTSSLVSSSPGGVTLHVDKSTQTEESFINHYSTPTTNVAILQPSHHHHHHHQQQQQQQHHHHHHHLRADTPTDMKIEKMLRQRLQRGCSQPPTTNVGSGGSSSGQQRSSSITSTTTTVEHSVSSQTLSPIHAKAMPVLIPPRPSLPSTRPMRNSVEGLNQEIEKLVLQPGQPHTCRPETNLFSRGRSGSDDTPEGHRAPLAELLHGSGGGGGGGVGGCGDTRSVNTQTPNLDLSSDESQSTSPEDGASSSGTGASPRINRFLAREPPDGCEKVSLKLTEMDQQTTMIFKPCVGFLLRPSLGSAFQPIIANSSSSSSSSSSAAAVSASAVAATSAAVPTDTDDTANNSDDNCDNRICGQHLLSIVDIDDNNRVDNNNDNGTSGSGAAARP